MKKVLFFILAAAVLLTACSKDSDPGKAEAALVSEIITVPVPKPCGNGRKSLQAIACDLLSFLFDAVASKKSPENGIIGIVIIVIIPIKITQQFFGTIIAMEVLCRLFTAERPHLPPVRQPANASTSTQRMCFSWSKVFISRSMAYFSDSYGI